MLWWELGFHSQPWCTVAVTLTTPGRGPFAAAPLPLAVSLRARPQFPIAEPQTPRSLKQFHLGAIRYKMTAWAGASEMEPRTKEPLVFCTWWHHRWPALFVQGVSSSQPPARALLSRAEHSTAGTAAAPRTTCTKAFPSSYQDRGIFQSPHTTKLA